MSGDLARINKEIKEIESIIDTYDLEAKRVVTFILLGEREEICRNIGIRSNVLNRLYAIDGKLDNKTLPSGTLVKKREEWIMKLEYVRMRINKLKMAQVYDMNVLKHNNFPLPPNILC